MYKGILIGYMVLMPFVSADTPSYSTGDTSKQLEKAVAEQRSEILLNIHMDEIRDDLTEIKNHRRDSLTLELHKK